MIKYDPNHYPPTSVEHIQLTELARDEFHDANEDEYRANGVRIGSDLFGNVRVGGGLDKAAKVEQMATELLIKELGDTACAYLDSYLEGVNVGIDFEAQSGAIDVSKGAVELQV